MNIPITSIKAFEVTGIDRNNKRFKKVYSKGENYRTAYEAAMMINLWNGSVWARLDNGTRKLLKRINN